MLPQQCSWAAVKQAAQSSAAATTDLVAIVIPFFGPLPKNKVKGLPFLQGGLAAAYFLLQMRQALALHPACDSIVAHVKTAAIGFGYATAVILAIKLCNNLAASALRSAVAAYMVRRIRQQLLLLPPDCNKAERVSHSDCREDGYARDGSCCTSLEDSSPTTSCPGSSLSDSQHLSRVAPDGG